MVKFKVQGQRRCERHEAREFDLHRHRTDSQLGRRRHAMLIGLENDRFARGRLHRDGGGRDSGARLVNDDQPQLSLAGHVLGDRRGGEQDESNEQALRELHAEHYSGPAPCGD